MSKYDESKLRVICVVLKPCKIDPGNVDTKSDCLTACVTIQFGELAVNKVKGIS